MMNVARFLWIPMLITLWSYSVAQDQTSNVRIVGAMKDVMWEGKLSGKIALDTISNSLNLFGLGPVEYLEGEILIVDGMAYKSSVLTDSTMKVEETYAIKAPFFAYANIANWSEIQLPETVKSIQELEQFLLGYTTQNLNRPFLFLFTGEVEQATIHIVNLPKGAVVSSPTDAHQGQKSFQLTNQNVDVLGFFSTIHKGIFTHHDTYLHMHLITSNKQKMGHLDEVRFKKGTIKIGYP